MEEKHKMNKETISANNWISGMSRRPRLAME
jgi:hypothetical protein